MNFFVDFLPSYENLVNQNLLEMNLPNDIVLRKNMMEIAKICMKFGSRLLTKFKFSGENFCIDLINLKSLGSEVKSLTENFLDNPTFKAWWRAFFDQRRPQRPYLPIWVESQTVKSLVHRTWQTVSVSR